MERSIPTTSLLGEFLASLEAAAHQSATDSEGFTDYEELDHELEQVDFLRDDLERDADILEVFAQETSRGV